MKQISNLLYLMTSLKDFEQTITPNTKFAHFTIISKIGSEGMGAVLVQFPISAHFSASSASQRCVGVRKYHRRDAEHAEVAQRRTQK